MGSTSFLGFSEPTSCFAELLVIFKELVTCFPASVGTFSWSLFTFMYLIWGLACDHRNPFHCLEEQEREGTG